MKVDIAVSRLRALTRAVVWTLPTAVLGAIAVSVFIRLDFSPTGLSNRLVDYGIAVAVAPLGILALITGWLTIRWLLLAVWPARVGVEATVDALILRLGPFGTQRYRARELSVRYPFELIGEDEDIGFEAYLPEEQQQETIVPRIERPGRPGRLNERILKFVGRSEPEVAAQLRPAVVRWRAEAGTQEADDDE